MDTAVQRYCGPVLLTMAGGSLAACLLAGNPQVLAESLFGAEPVPEGSILTVAQPLGDDRWTLVLVERLQPGRHCWRDQGDGSVKLRTADFLRPGLCTRAQSSSSFSLRAAGRDLPTYWRLRIEPVGTRLELQAFNPSQPTPITIGVGQKPAGDSKDTMPALRLNPGWTLEKRSYEGRLLSHLYLSSREPIGASLSASGELPIAPPPLPPRAEPRTVAQEPGQVIALQVIPFENP